MFLMFVISVW